MSFQYLRDIFANATPLQGPSGGGTPIKSVSTTLSPTKPPQSTGFQVLAPDPITGVLRAFSFGVPASTPNPGTTNAKSPISATLGRPRNNVVPTVTQNSSPKVPPPTPDPFSGIGSSILTSFQNAFKGFENYVAGNLATYGIGSGAATNTNTQVPTGSDSPTNPPSITPDTGSSPPQVNTPNPKDTTSKLFSAASLKSITPLAISLAIFIIVVMVVKKK